MLLPLCLRAAGLRLYGASKMARLMHLVAQMSAGVKFGVATFDSFIFRAVNFF